MRTLSSLLASRAGSIAALLASLCLARGAAAFNFVPIPDPNLDLQALGRVALAGDFDSISLYQYEGQNENAASPSTGSLLTRFPNGVFTSLQETDGEIHAMCPFISNGTLQGVVFGGNFTSVGGVAAQGIALLNPDNGKITALPGLNGSVNALFCDKDTSRVYVGGSFTGGGAQNAIVWVTDWTNMPFSGFNGPVKTIAKASNGNIIFGGTFDGLGNTTTPKEKDVQVIPITSANITAVATTTTAGFTDPRNIICKTGSQDGPGNTWLLEDTSPGSWTANFGFGFQPSKLRLYNTVQSDRGTKEWRYTALPDGGIMNFSYINPAGETAYCDSRCTLPQNNNTYQDFHFVNTVGMNSFRIDISDWYGKGAGLSGIELFENDIYSFAINDFNEPTCDGVSTGASSSSTGSWAVTPSGVSDAEYLTANLLGPNISDSTAVVFKPDIKQSGNYTVTIFTPGCTNDGTCGTRGRVNITGTMASSTKPNVPPFQSVQLFQTNNFDKYDQVYYGYVEANSDAFRPTITLTPVAGQQGPLTVVAQRVRFELNSPTTGGLNGLFEYEANKQVVSNDFSNSAIDAAGASLSPNQAPVTSLIVDGDNLYVGGNFTGDGFSNIFSVSDGNATSLPGKGLNSEVLTMYQNGSTIYVGGNFTNTADEKSTGLKGIAAYSTTNKAWQPLGAGVNGVVMYIVPLTLNFSDSTQESVVYISGTFDSVFGFGENKTFATENYAIWVPSRQNWLHNLNIATISISGVLMAQTDIPGSDPLFSGSISSQALGASGAVQMTSDKALGIQQFPISIRPQAASAPLQKRASTNQETIAGVVTGLIYTENNLNITLMAGHFAATGSDGSNITNLLFVNGSNSDQVTGMGDGIDSDSVFLSVATYGTTLYAGGVISGKVSDNDIEGLVVYDLSTASYATAQPAGLQGNDAAVTAIAPQPDSKDVYVGGNFLSAGALSCPSVCIWNTERNQWVSPGNGLSGNVSSMTWISNNKLLIGGNLTVGDNTTTMVTFNAQKHEFTEFTGASTVPGPVTAFCPANNGGSEFWVAGTASNNTAFLEKFDGENWVPITTGLGAGTNIRGLQVLSVSKNHDQTDLLEDDQVLLVLGQVNVTNFGNASAVLFNGTTFTPLILSNTASGAPGSLSQAFVENPHNFFSKNKHHLALGFVVLIGLAISLAITFIIVVAGIIIERLRKRAQGYVPANQQMFDKSSNLNRIPPEHLFGTLTGSGNGRGPL